MPFHASQQEETNMQWKQYARKAETQLSVTSINVFLHLSDYISEWEPWDKNILRWMYVSIKYVMHRVFKLMAVITLEKFESKNPTSCLAVSPSNFIIS